MSETKRYSKQEIIDLVATTETILKERRKKQEALPWTYSDLKRENKDLEFDLIQKKIKNALGCSATEYFTKHGYVYDPEKGYTEQQLNKLLYEFRNRKFKTMEAFIKATKKPECFYDIEAAITFVESAYHTDAVDYFMEKGILEPIAKQLALGGKTIYSFTEYSLPEREKIEGFVTKRVRTEDGAFRVYGEWASCLFKGFREDIEAMQQRYASISYMQVDNTDVDGIAVAECYENNDVPYIVDAIAEFPQLKFLAFYKDYENSSQVYTVYSESGYPFITASTFVGHFDYKSENPWVNEHTPDETFKYSELYIAVGETMSGNYKCPYTKEWNSLNYVVFENNITKIMTNNTDTTKRIESKKDMLKQARYPVTIDFDVYHEKCPHKVGEVLYLKKKGNEILLLDAKGKTLCSYCWVYMQFDAWECEPFKLSPQNHIKILGNELEELMARVSAIEDMTKKLNFYRVYVKISLIGDYDEEDDDEEDENEEKYKKAKAQFKRTKTVSGFEKVRAIFNELGDYEDSAEVCLLCDEKIAELKAAEEAAKAEEKRKAEKREADKKRREKRLRDNETFVNDCLDKVRKFQKRLDTLIAKEEKAYQAEVEKQVAALIAEQDEHRAILASLGLFKFADKKAQKQAILSLQEQIDAFRSTERLEKQRNEWESIASTAVKVYEKQVKEYIVKRFPKAFEKPLPPFAVGSRAKPPKDETIQQRNERMRWRALDALNKMNKIATVDDFEKVFPSWSSNQLRTTWVRSNVPYYVTRSVDKGKAFFEITEEGKKALQEEYDKQPADYTENPEFADLACPEPKDPTF